MHERNKERTPRSAAFHTAISNFITERREAKLKGASEETAEATSAKYDYTAWLADAARRVGQIQAVTHVLKATHPDARGNSLHAVPSTLRPHADIGTHSVGENYADDIVGNAAALDVYKFLKIEVEGRRLLDWLLADDADLLAALNDDAPTACEWATAFKGLIRPASTYASHEKAKQVYWCIGGDPTDDASFHLLQPLFSSTLAQVVHTNINDARFGEANTQARHAKRDKLAYDGVYCDYRGLVARKLGGTKPQNISQLNSERGGVNYLLASLPPKWDQDQPKQFLGIKSALDRFPHYDGVRSLIRALCDFLADNPKPIMETRIERERIERTLGTALAAFGLETQQRFPPGWTRNEDCKLPDYEKLWLDPERANLPPREDHSDEDKAFAHDFGWKDWPDQVATHFGHWLNAILRERSLSVGDTELAHWTKQAIVEVTDWPAPMRRRVFVSSQREESTHG